MITFHISILHLQIILLTHSSHHTRITFTKKCFDQYQQFSSLPNDYMPQGAQFNDSLASLSLDDKITVFHDLPTAARKKFSPLHDFDENLSDPGKVLIPISH